MGISQKVCAEQPTHLPSDLPHPKFEEETHIQLTTDVINMISVGPQLWGADNFENTPKWQQTNNDIIFTAEDVQGVQTPHDDAIVVSMAIANYHVKQCLIDNGCSIDVIFYDCFSRMKLCTNLLKSVSIPLVEFTNDSIKVENEIELPVTIGQSSRQSTMHLNFLVVRIPSTYNIILGWSELNTLQAIVSTYHLFVCFSIKKGVGKMRGDQQLAR